VNRPLEDEERRLLPRWRESRSAAAADELTPVPVRAAESSTRDDGIAAKQAAWKEYRTLAHAGDLVSSAIVVGREEDAVDAAEFLLNSKSGASEEARRVARALLRIEHVEPETRIASFGEKDSEAAARIGAEIRRNRRRLVRFPDDPISWVDVSRLFAVLGLTDKADRAMRAALTLAPNHRFTLRSGARLYVHLGDAQRAVEILRRSPATPTDPWLVAAEVSSSMVAERTPRFANVAKQLLSSDNFSPFETAELAGSLASLTLKDGSASKAKKLFAQSLRNPTENAVAQAEWASQRMKASLVEKHHLELPQSFEARALESYSAANWERALSEGEQWQLDELFSTRPAEFGSFVAGTAVGDFTRAERFARLGLRSQPNDKMLLNNLAFALASSDRVEEAAEVISRIKMSELTEDGRTASIATAGLILFRSGEPALGRQYYETAISRAHRMGNRFQEVLATVLLAREELRMRSDRASAVLSRAQQLAEKSAHPMLKSALALVEASSKTSQ
jgi:tetratricopeptide (TPR) repeat protein